MKLKTLITGLAVLIVAPSVAFAQVRYLVAGLGGATSAAYGINNNGQVVGYFRNASGDRHAFLYSGGIMSDLGTLPGGTFSYAYGINDSGQVVGYSHYSYYTPGGPASGVPACRQRGDHDELGHRHRERELRLRHQRQRSGGGILRKHRRRQCLPLQRGDTHNARATPVGARNDCAEGINNNGQVVGYFRNASGDRHAFLYSGEIMTDLGTLGGTTSHAHGINNSGQVVGSAYTASVWLRAFLHSGGIMTDLGTLGGTSSAAYGINNNGQVVGSPDPASGAYPRLSLQRGGSWPT